jgi:FkbH-like protein
MFVPDFPADPVDLVPQLAASGRFAIPITSAEDQRRTAMYEDEKERKRLRTSFVDLDSYYASLHLALSPTELDATNEQRILELIAKTNQFNLTTRRRTREELGRLRSGQGNHVWAYSLRDRLGAYGVIAAVLGVREGDVLRIDTWVMSCRAMGRTVERGIFAHVLACAVRDGIRYIEGEFIPSLKNKPVAELYTSLGFTPDRVEGASRFFRFDAERGTCENLYVRIEQPEAVVVESQGSKS